MLVFDLFAERRAEVYVREVQAFAASKTQD
jgi:hypothetical protein